MFLICLTRFVRCDAERSILPVHEIGCVHGSCYVVFCLGSLNVLQLARLSQHTCSGFVWSVNSYIAKFFPWRARRSIFGGVLVDTEVPERFHWQPPKNYSYWRTCFAFGSDKPDDANELIWQAWEAGERPGKHERRREPR